MKPKIQNQRHATSLAQLQVRNYQGIQSFVLEIPANPSFISTQFQERTGLKVNTFLKKY